MSISSPDEALRNLALLYLALAHGADDYLSDSELRTVIHQIERRFPDLVADTHSAQEVVMEALSVYADAEEPLTLLSDAMGALRDSISLEDRARFLDDLSHVARADGVVLRDERGLLATLAATWDVPLEAESIAQPVGDTSSAAMRPDVMHDLAFIYLVLGHGTDFELSESETQMMIRRLTEWQPQMEETQIHAVLEEAMNRYAEGAEDEALNAAIQSVKSHLPHEQRMAALHDLIKIANADGVFLDDEEDLINRLLTEWEVDPYANYGSHGRKQAE